ncbi:MAG: hypothetical protein KKH45_11305 [Proteobacteria bacterium]|nr:hypothetical protein [Pseudomonadota bacterium]
MIKKMQYVKSFLRELFDDYMRNNMFFRKRISIKDEFGIEVTVSLTTTSFRIHQISKVIRTLLNQSYIPERVVLWVSLEPYLKDEGVNEIDIPAKLKKMQSKSIFEIAWTKNIGSYRKLIPSLMKYEGVIVTADDDTFYPRDWLKRLFDMYLENPHHICCYRGTKMQKNNDGSFVLYAKWKSFESDENGRYCFPTGKDGILYPLESLSREVFNEEAFKKLAPTGDDIWFKAMSMLNNTLVRKIRDHKDFPTLPSSDETGLLSINKVANDEQIIAVFNEYNIT